MNRQPPVNPQVNASTANDESEYLTYGLLAEELEEAKKAGREPNIAPLIQAHPELAGEIHGLLPTLLSLHELAGPEFSNKDTANAECHYGTIGDFRIVGELGRGGMGIVYKAEQISLRRMVALKVLPFAAVLDSKQLQRFKNEAQAAALLKHSNIVSVYSVGCERGIHYYAMELIDGPSLADVIDQLRRERATTTRGRTVASTGTRAEVEVDTQTSASLSTDYSANRKEFFRTAARTAIQAAEALEFAHQAGIVHRDIKPSNLLLDRDGEVWITDFGLARVQSEGGMTITGDLIGTIRYMSPEQASGNPALVDRRSDVYSLGAVLYELITVSPVLRSSDRQALLRELDTTEPALPSHFDNLVPRDLETILLKSLAKNPQERYITAQEMADDLKRFVEHRPIVARRSGRLGKLCSWARRNPAVATLTTAVFLLLVALSAGSSFVAWQQYQETLSREDEIRVKAEEARISEIEIYGRDIKLISNQLDQGNSIGAAAKLRWWAEHDLDNRLRGFEFQYLVNRCRTRAAYSEKQSLLDHHSAAYSPKGRYLAIVGYGKEIRIWDALSSKKVFQTIKSEAGTISRLRFLANGLLVSADHEGNVFVWDIDSKSPIESPKERADELDLPHRERHIQELIVSTNGRLLAVAAGNFVSSGVEQAGHLFVWDRDQRTWVARMSDFVGTPSGVFTSDGSQLITGCGRGQLRAWSTETWKTVHEKQWLDNGRITSLAMAPDGSRMAVATSTKRGVHKRICVDLCDSKSWLKLSSNFSHTGPVRCLRFRNQSDLLAAGSEDHTVSLYDIKSGNSVRTPIIHQGKINDLDFTPDGKYLCTSSLDTTTRVWRVRDLLNPEETVVEFGNQHVGNVWGAAFVDKEGKTACSCDENGNVLLWNVKSKEVLGHFHATLNDATVAIPAVCPRGERLAIISGHWPPQDQPGRVDFLDSSLNHLGSVDLPKGRLVHGKAFSPDSKFLAVACKQYVTIIDVDKREIVKEIGPFASWIKEVDFNPVEPIFAFTGDHGKIHLHDAKTFQPICDPIEVGHSLHTICFSPDGQCFAAPCMDGFRLWDTKTHTILRKVKYAQDPDIPLHMTFSPDGGRILTSGIAGKLRLWHRNTGEELLVLAMDEFWLLNGSFSADGSSIIAGNGAFARVFPAAAQDALLEFEVEQFPHLGCEY